MPVVVEEVPVNPEPAPEEPSVVIHGSTDSDSGTEPNSEFSANQPESEKVDAATDSEEPIICRQPSLSLKDGPEEEEPLPYTYDFERVNYEEGEGFD